MIDCCFDSLSGLTSQPSMGAIVNALSGTELDTGIDPKLILPLSTYWEQVQGWRCYALYSPNPRMNPSPPYLEANPLRLFASPSPSPLPPPLQTRELYAPFESNMKAVSSDVYMHEMPGGQVRACES